MVTLQEVVDAVEVVKALIEAAHQKYGMDGAIPIEEYQAILDAAETHQKLFDAYVRQVK